MHKNLLAEFPKINLDYQSHTFKTMITCTFAFLTLFLPSLNN